MSRKVNWLFILEETVFEAALIVVTVYIIIHWVNFLFRAKGSNK